MECCSVGITGSVCKIILCLGAVVEMTGVRSGTGPFATLSDDNASALAQSGLQYSTLPHSHI